MDGLLVKHINSLKEAKVKKYQDYLLKNDVCTIEYSPIDEISTEYPESAYSEKQQKTVYFKKTPITLNEEDIEELDKYVIIETENHIANVIKVIAIIIYFVGFICGIVLGVDGSGYKTEFSFSIALIYWCASAVSGTMTLGFSEIINLLHKISQK